MDPSPQVAVLILLNYMENTWTRTVDHFAKGHRLGETLTDPDYPSQDGWSKRLSQKNIELMYTAIASKKNVIPAGEKQ